MSNRSWRLAFGDGAKQRQVAVQAGASAGAQALLGETVAFIGRATYSQLMCVPFEQMALATPLRSVRDARGFAGEHFSLVGELRAALAGHHVGHRAAGRHRNDVAT